jgi:hypothetical protein
MWTSSSLLPKATSARHGSKGIACTPPTLPVGTTHGPPGERDVAGHRWLTADFVLLDGLLATPSGTRVAEPLHILVGDEVLGRQLVMRTTITAKKHKERGNEIALHPVEQLYGQLKLALRRHGLPNHSADP